MSAGFGFSSASQRASNRTKDITPGEFMLLRPEAANLFIDAAANPPGFNGPFTSPIGKTERGLLSDFTNSGQSPLGGDLEEFLSKTLRGDFLRPGSNPFLQEQLDFLLKNVAEQRDIGRRENLGTFSRAGQRRQDSSPFAFAEAINNRANSGTEAATDLLFRNFQAGQDRQAQVSQQAGQFLTQKFDRAKQQLEASALPRLIEQFGIDQGVKEFERRMNFTRDLLQILAQVTSATPGAFGESKGDSIGFNASAGIGGGG